VLLGADLPHIDVAELRCVLEWLAPMDPLSNARHALAPASDGGFWLYGATALAPLPCWTHVEYSAPDTADQFAHAMDDGGDWRIFKTETDVDSGADLVTCQRALMALAQPMAAQRALGVWMQGLSD
jgi:uncharacterized protein